MSIAALLLLALLPAADIHGTVRAEGTSAPIPRATVQIPELHRAVVADERGYFVLPGVEPGRWTVRASALGFRPHEVLVQAPRGGSVRLDFDLAAEPVSLDPVEVRGREGGTGARGAASAGPGATRIDGRAVKATPALAEADVMRALQTLPSVAAASDYSSAPYVRGGLPDQNLVLLDGIPLYNPYHLGGIFGAVDPDAVQSVDLLAGAFPADVGDRLSSAIDIHTREGGRDRTRGTGSVGLISSRLGFDGPLPGGRGSYLLSGRHTYLDLFTRGAEGVGLIRQHLPYGFSDAHLKVSRDVGAMGRLSASAYVNDEGFVYRDPEPGSRQSIDFGWGSRAFGVRYWRPWGAALAGEVRAAFSEFGGRFDAGEHRWSNERQVYEDTLTRQLQARTTATNALLGADLTWYGARHRVRAGTEGDWYRFDHRVLPIEEDFEDALPPFRQTDTPRTLAAYLEDEWRPGERLSLRAGVRVLAAGERGTAWMPRLGVRYALAPSLNVWAGAGRSAQVMHSLRESESVAAAVVAYDILAAVPERMGLTLADDAVLGGEWSSRRVSVRVEGYDKRFRHLPVTPVSDSSVYGGLAVPQEFRAGTGRARGVEVLAQYAGERSGVTLAYTLAHTEREVDGFRFTPRFDRRHALDLTGYAPWGGRGEVSARMVLATGQPYTPILGVLAPRSYPPEAGGFVAQQPLTPILGEYNSARLPTYVRLDLGARRSYQRHWFGRETTVTPYLQVINVLNSRNVLFAYPQGGNSEMLLLHYAPQLPLFPTLGVEWKF